MTTKTYLGAVAVFTLSLLASPAIASTQAAVPNTYGDYDGGLPVYGLGVSDTYADYDGGLPVADPGTLDTYADYDGGLPVRTAGAALAPADTRAVLAAIRENCEVTDRDMRLAEPHVADFCACEGDPAALVQVLATSSRMGCRGECFAQVAQCMGQGLGAGLTAQQAADLVFDSLLQVQYWCDQQDTGISAGELAEQLDERFGDRLAAAYGW